MAERRREDLVELNDATVEELLAIGRISEGAAEAIVEFRERHDGFKTLDQLERIPQITADEFMILRDAVQITTEEKYDAHRLEKPDQPRQPGGKGI